MPDELDFESLVARFYKALYQFAYSLTQSDQDAWDLTQQTFYRWAAKGHQLRDGSKVKTWLFSTLHHEFLNSRRRQKSFPHFELSINRQSPRCRPGAQGPLTNRSCLPGACGSVLFGRLFLPRDR